MKYLTLDDVCLLNMGQSPDSSTYNEVGEGLPFYQGNADFGERYPQCRIWCSEPTKIAEKEDVLISVRAPIGALNEAREKCCIGRGLAAIRPKGGLNKDFLYYFLLSKKSYLISKGTGSTFKAISKNVLRELTIPVPTLQEQEKQSGILNTLWRVICKRRTQQAKLDELIKCRFVELFGDQKMNPYGWPQTTVGNCCILKSGTSLPADKENEGGTIPYVKVSDMNYPGNEHYITTSSRFVTEQTAGVGVFPVGTVIFPKRGGAIGTNKKRLTKLPICADLNVMGVIAGSNLASQYLMAYFDMIDLGALDNGSSVPQINNKDIAPLPICTPPIELQEQFAAFVEKADKFKFACFFFQLITVLQKIIIFFRNFLICFLF
ncbi:restriction endonuclease subunit S [Akkermansia muciniphila]|uniref:restriction endonuclease subunit S n=1 Tax=Akkermansia muciniphila TaxID=239935 RepID=UPI00201E3794|nr:restriction endonuclease subunit S [Akkermansia muciniphila]MCL6681698.1 restriction endonuclease subunit S [Akkermansia muciniphila]